MNTMKNMRNHESHENHEIRRKLCRISVNLQKIDEFADTLKIRINYTNLSTMSEKAVQFYFCDKFFVSSFFCVSSGCIDFRNDRVPASFKRAASVFFCFLKLMIFFIYFEPFFDANSCNHGPREHAVTPFEGGWSFVH